MTATEVERIVEARMLSEHNIALGVFGIPEGAGGTFTQASFYDEAKRRGLITPGEYQAVKAWNIGRWYDDLSD